MLSTSELGRKFELKVKDVLTTLGYNVIHDIEVDGLQIDLVARIINPLGAVDKVIVECKYKSDENNVSGEEVTKFLHTSNAIRESEKQTHAMLVSNTGFTKNAKAIARKNDLLLVLYEELMPGRNNFKRYYYFVKFDFLKSNKIKNYIQLPARNVKNNETYKSVLYTLYSKLHLENKNVFFLLGDFGRGKTTTAEELFKILTKSYLKNEIDTPPFIFRLQYFGNAISLQHFVKSELEFRFGVNFDIGIFLE